MRSQFTAALAATALALLSASAPVAAQNVTFSGHGTSSTTYGALQPGAFYFSFLLPQNPVPDLTGPDEFTLDGVAGTVTQGTATTSVAGTLGFFVSGAGGGFEMSLDTSYVASALGPQLFTGSTETPTFATGTYTGFSLGAPDVTNTTISDVSITSTPEPGELTLLGTGLVALAPIVRRRRRAA